MKLSSNNYKNEIIDDNNQRFRRIPIDWFHEKQTSVKPTLYEQTVTTTTTTTINKETNSKIDEMTTIHLEKSPMRRVNIVTGPQSAFARLFPDKYRQEQEELLRKQRSKSLDNRPYKFDRITTSDNDERKSRRVSFYDQVLSDQNRLNTSTKYDSYLQEDITRMPLNYDPNPEIIYRDNPNKLVYVQKVGVRYLKPPTPPPPGPIIIRERQSTPLQELPPMIISTTPPNIPPTPSPLIVREQPPTPPLYQPTKIITKTLPPQAPSRRVIIKRIPPLPAKPRPVIIEKWLPYKTPAERPILYERAEQSEPTHSTQRNVILQYEPAHVRVEQEIQNAGCYRVDPEIYRTQFGSQLRRTDSIRRVLQDIGCNPDLITSAGYNTSYSSNQINNSSHYDYPRENTTCFTDGQLAELIDPSSVSRNNNEIYYTTVLPNN